MKLVWWKKIKKSTVMFVCTEQKSLKVRGRKPFDQSGDSGNFLLDKEVEHFATTGPRCMTKSSPLSRMHLNNQGEEGFELKEGNPFIKSGVSCGGVF